MRFGEGRICKIFRRERKVTNAADYLKQLQPAPAATSLPLGIRVLRRDPRAKLPIRALPGAVGLDVSAFLLSETGRPMTKAIHQKAVTAIPTGISVEPPNGYFLQVCSRSGLAKRGIFVANAPGIIDPDYTGELIILLFNGSHETQYISHEHRIAQLVLAPAIFASAQETNSLARQTDRGEEGFGSTGA